MSSREKEFDSFEVFPRIVPESRCDDEKGRKQSHEVKRMVLTKKRQSGTYFPKSMNANLNTQSLPEQQDSMANRHCRAPLNSSVSAGSPSGQGTAETMVPPDPSAEDVPKPKRPRTAYNLFFRHQQENINDARQRNPKASKTATAVSACWKNLPHNKKAVYFQMATEDKFRYYKEKHEYATHTMRLKEEMRVGAERAEFAAGAMGHGDRGHVPAQVHVIRDDKNSTAIPGEVDVPPFPHEAIALLASQLDQQSIDFLIKALK